MTDVSRKLNNSWIWDAEAFSEQDQVIYLPARVCAIHAVAYLNEGDQAEIARLPGNHWVFIVDLIHPGSSPASLRFSMESGESSKYAGSLNLAMMAAVDSDAFIIHARRTSGEFAAAVSLQEVVRFMMQVRARLIDDHRHD
ncbi:hypothetical protein BDZ89DRAFT_1129611 [Hymenopellis radicata]|nr:hypothetical protein BDZ89DRAFT_1129611 [Hymenopellis radicata]